ncbi:hypothetical protein [Acinetobacter sp. P8-3-8]|uniref:hypothetical protein n=1 Tax=Acinetobacter sp. P8-3-8 TaxID=1029823 RepID=UPI0002485B00|nr:hypothetical protein [Acinetobacter sp. P8-3-8]
MVQLIKKGGLRERANRSRKYAESENSIKTLDPHRYAISNQDNNENSQVEAETVQTQSAIENSLQKKKD